MNSVRSFRAGTLLWPFNTGRTTNSYLRALARGDMRRNLDGSDAGVPTEDQRKHARQVLAERERRKLEQIQRRRHMQAAVNDAA